MKNKKRKINKGKLDKIFTMSLLVCLILTVIISFVLFFSGIKKILPIILVYILGITSAFIIYLLSRDVLSMKKNRDKKIAKKINV